MRLRELQVSSFRCFAEFEIEFGDANVQLIVAPNGQGKTALLSAAASLLGSFVHFLGLRHDHTFPIQHSDVHTHWTVQQNHEKVNQSIPNYPCRLAAKACVADTCFNWTKSLNRAQSEWNEKKKNSVELEELVERLREKSNAIGDSNASFPLIAYYSAQRFLNQGKDVSDVESPLPRIDQLDLTLRPVTRLNGYEFALDCEKTKWADLQKWLFGETSFANQLQLPRTPALEAAYSVVRQLLELDVEPYYDPQYTKEMMITLPGQERPVPHSILSDGYRTSLGIALDLSRRSALLNPHLGIDSCKRISGVVLIDEIDLHLHPEWQRRVVRNLANAFPNIQFLMTTHSASVVSGAAGISDIYVIEFDDTNQNLVPRKVCPSEYSDVSRLLSSNLFKLESTSDPRLVSKIERLSNLTRREERLDDDERIELNELREEFQRASRSIPGSTVESLVSDIIGDLQIDEDVQLANRSWKEIQVLRANVLQIIRKAANNE